MMLKSLPRYKLAHLPTPVEELGRLSKALGGPKLFVKRDDQTGLAFGGNKTRKLEYLIASAFSQDANMLITGGAVQSNHCRQTAAAAAKVGMSCTLVLTGEQPEQPEGNTLLDVLFGANLVWTTREERDEILRLTFERAQEEGHNPFLIPYGGSNPLGASAYAYAVREFMSQDVNVDWIVFASSSGGTQAGLVLGARGYKFTGRILGISVDKPASVLQTLVADIATRTAQYLGTSDEFTDRDILVNDDYCGPGYAVLSEIELEAILLFARYEGLLVDPVYTGRAAAGLVDLIRKGFFGRDERVLFWHTGGTPALFVAEYQKELIKVNLG
jgi:D-cysteine desulfhydrase family pyridoxal phosphate-dependent enzyme